MRVAIANYTPNYYKLVEERSVKSHTAFYSFVWTDYCPEILDILILHFLVKESIVHDLLNTFPISLSFFLFFMSSESVLLLHFLC
jgi:hypothetical protein